MLIEKTLKEALADYIKGKPVTVLWTRDDGSMDARLLSDILEQEENHFLVNVPAYHNPEFAQAVAEMVERKGTDDYSREVTPTGITEKDGSTTPPHTEPDPEVIPAENKREKALELAKEGKGAAEIARMIDAKYVAWNDDKEDYSAWKWTGLCNGRRRTEYDRKAESAGGFPRAFLRRE